MQSAIEDNKEELEKVYCSELKTGMYVQELDRPWLETPFMFQGFYIKNDQEIEALRQHCEYVHINKAREDIDTRITHEKVNHVEEVDSKQPDTSLIKAIAGNAGNSKYTDTTVVEKELETAEVIYTESSSIVESLFSTARDDGMVNIQDVSNTTASIVGSILRNPDAFLLLQKIKSKDRYRYTHAINCCALAATFCRHLGFSKEEIHDISMGALMLDIGITRLPDSMIEMKGTLNPLSMKLIRHHVKFSVEILDNTPNMPAIAHEMALTHHERVNGNGYPNGLKGEQIPVSGRIAAIVDCYDAMISNRPHKGRITPTEAICSMYNWRNIDFHEDLIEQFVQCIGAYPTGALVELTSGQIAIVIAQNRVRRLYPKVLLILNADGDRYDDPKTVDLWEYAQKTKGIILDIKKVVDADEYGIQPSDYYL